MWYGSLVTLVILAAGPIYLYHRRLRSNDRKRVLPACEERIVILGASSVNGIGAAIAAQCLARGAHNILLVGRRSDALREVKIALIAQQDTPEQRERAEQLQLFVADCTDEEDVLRIADSVTQNFGGIDTVYIVFGIMCGQPLLALADMDPMAGATRTQPTLNSLRSVSEVAQQCSNANMTGTALVLAALIPCLQTTSKSPYVALIGSLAALIPAPTRSLYCATKAAQQMLVQSVASECRAQAEKKGRALVQFVTVAPSTVSTSFSTRLVIGGRDRRAHPPSNAMSAEHVGKLAVQCVDTNRTGIVPIPFSYFFVWLLSPIISPWIERGARRRYDY